MNLYISKGQANFPMLEVISQTANPTEKRIKPKERYWPNAGSYNVKRKVPYRKLLKSRFFLFRSFVLLRSGIFLVVRKTRVIFQQREKKSGNGSVATKKTETAIEKKWQEKWSRSSLQQTWDRRLIVGWNDIGVTGMGVYAASFFLILHEALWDIQESLEKRKFLCTLPVGEI